MKTFIIATLLILTNIITGEDSNIKLACDALNNNKPLEVLEILKDEKELSANLFLIRAEAYKQLNKPTLAIENYKLALKQNGKMKNAAMGMLQTLASIEKWDEAKTVASKWINPFTGSNNDIRLYSMIVFYSGDIALAEQIAKNGITRFPDDEKMRRQLISYQIEINDFNSARKNINSLLEKNENDSKLWFYLAKCHTDPAKKRQALEASLLLENTISTRRILVSEYLKANLHKEAFSFAKELLNFKNITDKDKELIIYTALLSKKHKFAKEIIATVKQKTKNINNMSIQIALTENDKTAINKLITAGVANEHLYIKAAELEVKDKNFSKAELLYRTTIKNHDSSNAKLLLARLLIKQNKKLEAKYMLEAFLKKEPNNKSAKQMLKFTE